MVFLRCSDFTVASFSCLVAKIKAALSWLIFLWEFCLAEIGIDLLDGAALAGDLSKDPDNSFLSNAGGLLSPLNEVLSIYFGFSRMLPLGL